VKELLKKFNMHDVKEMKTLMHPTIWLGLDKESNNVDNHKYRIMFGSLLYLTTSRPCWTSGLNNLRGRVN